MVYYGQLQVTFPNNHFFLQWQFFVSILIFLYLFTIPRCSFNQDSVSVLWDVRSGHGCYSCKNNKMASSSDRAPDNPEESERICHKRKYVSHRIESQSTGESGGIWKNMSQKGSMYHIALSIKQDQFPKIIVPTEFYHHAPFYVKYVHRNLPVLWNEVWSVPGSVILRH